eukprot:RCo017766
MRQLQELAAPPAQSASPAVPRFPVCDDPLCQGCRILESSSIEPFRGQFGAAAVPTSASACLHPSDSVCRAPVAPGSQLCPHHTSPQCRQDKSSRESMCGRCSDRARAAHAMPRPCAHGNGQQCMGQAVSGSTLCSAHRCSVAGCGREKSSGQPLCTEHAAMASPQPGTAA